MMTKTFLSVVILCCLLSLSLSLSLKAEEFTTQEKPLIPESASATQQPSSTSSVKPQNTNAAPALMRVKRLETAQPLYSFELRDAEIGDLFRMLAHDYRLNLIIDKEVSGRLTASFDSISLEEALEAIAESQNITMEKKGTVTRVLPNLITKIFPLKYVEAEKLLGDAGASNTVSGAGTSMAKTMETVASSSAGPGQNQTSGTDSSASNAGTHPQQGNTLYDLLSEKGKILLGNQPNSLMVIDYPSNIKKIEEYLNAIDQKRSVKIFKLKYLNAAEITSDTAGRSATASSYSTAASSPSTMAGSSSMTEGGS